MRIAILAAALLLCAPAALGQSDRGFRIKIPCETQQSGTDQHIIMSCKTSDGIFAMEMLLDPGQTPQEDLFATAGKDIAKELGAEPRQVQTIVRNGKTGRDIITDIAGHGLTERDQLWTSPYVLFKIKFKGATGTETGKAATEFLESFASSP